MGNCMSDADRTTGIAGGGRSLGPDDGDAVFEAMQARLDEITRLPIVRGDAVARRLLDDMARSDALDDVLVLLEQLDARVRLLLKGRASQAADTRRERAPRTLLRL